MADTCRMSGLGALVAAVLVLSGCTGGGEDQTVAESPAAAAPTGASAPSDVASEPIQPTDAVPTEAGTTDAAAGDADSAEPLASVTIPINYLEDAEMEAAVTSIELSGDLLRVAIRFTAQLPLEAEDVAIGAVLQGNENAPGASVDPELIDPVNLKAYELVAGGGAHGTSVELVHDTPRTLVFYYAAPQDEVESFDVHWPPAPPITDVPFQQ